MHIFIFDISFQEKVKNYFLFSVIFCIIFHVLPQKILNAPRARVQTFFFLNNLLIINSKWQYSVNIGIYKYITVRKEFRMEEKETEQIEVEK